MEDLARIAAAHGDAGRAARALGAVANLREEAGAAPLPVGREAMDRLAGSLRAALGDAAFAAAFAAGQALSLPQALDLATTLHGEAAPKGAEVAAGARAAGVPVLSVNALGPLEIALDGALLAAGAWSSAKSRELLLYLLCHPAGRTREQIGHALWRDASPAQIKSNLHVTLHELRRTLGRPDWIVFEEERYRVNPGFAVEFDARQFEAEVRAARVALAKTGDTASLERALQRYNGDFWGNRDSGLGTGPSNTVSAGGGCTSRVGGCGMRHRCNRPSVIPCSLRVS
jgi:hypothetical protein